MLKSKEDEMHLMKKKDLASDPSGSRRTVGLRSTKRRFIGQVSAQVPMVKALNIEWEKMTRRRHIGGIQWIDSHGRKRKNGREGVDEGGSPRSCAERLQR